jgi:hypothetical protein
LAGEDKEAVMIAEQLVRDAGGGKAGRRLELSAPWTMAFA